MCTIKFHALTSDSSTVDASAHVIAIRQPGPAGRAGRLKAIFCGSRVFEDIGMPTKGRMFAGCTVALVTPFRDGEVD